MVGVGGNGIAGEVTGEAAGWQRVEWDAMGVRRKDYDRVLAAHGFWGSVF